jgi:uncharacterized protein (DUF2384 family)
MAANLTAEIEQTVRAFFVGDEVKVQRWFETPNPMLGGISPQVMMREPHTLKKVHRYVTEAANAQRVADDRERVLAQATKLVGNADRAAYWFQMRPIADLGGKTAQELVIEGRVDVVIQYIESLEAGAAG